MKTLGTLKAAYKAATPGTWRYEEGLSVIVVIGKPNVEAVADFRKINNAGSDANFITIAHNMMPLLLEAVELLKNTVNPFKNDQHNHDKVLDLLVKLETTRQ